MKTDTVVVYFHGEFYHLRERAGIPGRIFSYTAARGGREAQARDYSTCGKHDGTSEHRDVS